MRLEADDIKILKDTLIDFIESQHDDPVHYWSASADHWKSDRIKYAYDHIKWNATILSKYYDYSFEYMNVRSVILERLIHDTISECVYMLRTGGDDRTIEALFDELFLELTPELHFDFTDGNQFYVEMLAQSMLSRIEAAEPSQELAVEVIKDGIRLSFLDFIHGD